MSESRPDLGGFLIKHSTIYGLGSLLGKAVSILLLPLYTSRLTPADYGILELLETSSSMLGVVVSVGLLSAMARHYYEQPTARERRRIVSTTVLLVAAMCVLVLGPACLGASALSRLMFDDAKYGSYFVMSIVTLGMGVFVDLVMAYFRILSRALAFVTISLANLSGTVLLTIWFVVYQDMGVYGVLLAALIVRGALTAFCLVFLTVAVGWGLNWTAGKSMLRYSWPLIPSDMMNSIVGYSDRYFINHHISLAAAGFYSLTQKLGTVLHTLITGPFLLAFMPKRFEIADEPDAPEKLAEIYRLYMWVMVTATFVLAIGADFVVAVMTDPAFFEAARYVPLTAAAMVMLGVKYHYQFGILYSKKTKYIMYTNGVSLVTQLAGNALLIPVLSIWGALLAYVFSQSVALALYYFFSQREYRVDYSLGWTARLCLSATLGACVSLFAPQGALFMEFVWGAASAVTFVLLLLAFRVLKRHELERVIAAFRGLFRRPERR